MTRTDILDSVKCLAAYFAPVANHSQGLFGVNISVLCLQEAPHLRLITFEAEVSRERVPLRNAYKAAGQKAVVRVNGGEARHLVVSKTT